MRRLGLQKPMVPVLNHSGFGVILGIPQQTLHLLVEMYFLDTGIVSLNVVGVTAITTSPFDVIGGILRCCSGLLVGKHCHVKWLKALSWYSYPTEI